MKKRFYNKQEKEQEKERTEEGNQNQQDGNISFKCILLTTMQSNKLAHQRFHPKGTQISDSQM